MFSSARTGLIKLNMRLMMSLTHVRIVLFWDTKLRNRGPHSPTYRRPSPCLERVPSIATRSVVRTSQDGEIRVSSDLRQRTVSGQVYVKKRVKGPVWYMRVRLPYGGEERKAIGAAAWNGTAAHLTATSPAAQPRPNSTRGSPISAAASASRPGRAARSATPPSTGIAAARAARTGSPPRNATTAPHSTATSSPPSATSDLDEVTTGRSSAGALDNGDSTGRHIPPRAHRRKARRDAPQHLRGGAKGVRR